MKILFVVEGGKEIGMGHIVRAITLADEIKESTSIQFVTTSDSAVRELINAKGYNVHHYENDDILIEHFSDFSVNTIIVDRPPVDEKYIKQVRHSTNARLVLMDSGEEASRWADIAINGLWAPEFKNKKYINESSKTLHFYGPRYLILRNQFSEYSIEALPKIEKVRRILLIFGGSDPSNLTTKTLNGLLFLQNSQMRITVVMGPKFEYSGDIGLVINQHKAEERVTLVQNPEAIAELMHNHELVFVSPGLAMFEALSMGLHVIASCQNDLQRNVYRYFLENDASIPAPFHFLPNSFYLSPRQRKVQKMQIGKGKKEVIASILGTE